MKVVLLVAEASQGNMNKHTDDQSSPTFPPASSEDDFEYSGHLPLASTGLIQQARGNLNDDGNEDKVQAPIPVRKFWKKPIDMPKRPMSSYNIFYRMERERLIEGGRLHSYTSEDVNQFVAQQEIKMSVQSQNVNIVGLMEKSYLQNSLG